MTHAVRTLWPLGLTLLVLLFLAASAHAVKDLVHKQPAFSDEDVERWAEHAQKEASSFSNTAKRSVSFLKGMVETSVKKDFRKVCCPKKKTAELCRNKKVTGSQFQKCTGATGYDCDGVPEIERVKGVFTDKSLASQLFKRSFPLTQTIPGSPGKIIGVTSVGSIYHDICCFHHPHGRFCNSHNQRLVSIFDGSDKENKCACSIEWRKAVFNLFMGRVWHEEYSTADYSSDMTPVSEQDTRKAWFPLGLGRFMSKRSNLALRETVGTRRLSAPSMTRLDCPYEDTRCRLRPGKRYMTFQGGIVAGDSVFCKHKRFALIRRTAKFHLGIKQRYGICMCMADSECGEGEVCNEGLCGASNCKKDKHCYKGQVCVDSKCRAKYKRNALKVWVKAH